MRLPCRQTCVLPGVCRPLEFDGKAIQFDRGRSVFFHEVQMISSPGTSVKVCAALREEGSSLLFVQSLQRHFNSRIPAPGWIENPCLSEPGLLAASAWLVRCTRYPF